MGVGWISSKTTLGVAVLSGAMGVESEMVLSSDGGRVLKKWRGAKVFKVGTFFDSDCDTAREVFFWWRGGRWQKVV